MYFVWLPHAGAVPSTGYQEMLVVLRASCEEASLRRTVSELSTPALEEAWCGIYDELVPGMALTRRTALVRLRGLILDEIEQRSPRRYRKWLRQGGPHRRRTQTPSVIVC